MLREVLVEEGDYRALFHLLPSHDASSLRLIGSGTFGWVMSVADTALPHASSVAVKRFTRPFESLQHARRTLREILCLKYLSGGPHNHILQFLGVYSPQAATGAELQDLYLVTELCDSDLRTVLGHNRLTEEHIQLILYRVACGLRYMHSAGIIHRDLKPENVAVFADCEVRILDLGLCRGGHNVDDTPYVQTRYYRAPEVVCLCPYDVKADIWSFGCILAECYGGGPAFPGQSNPEQMLEFVRRLGPPPESFMQMVPTDAVRTYIQSLGTCEAVSFWDLLPTASLEALLLLSSIFVYDPTLRPTAEELLNHAFFTSVRQPETELTCPAFDSSFENEELEINDIQQRIRRECIQSQALWPDAAGAPIGSFPVRVSKYEMLGLPPIPGTAPMTVTPIGTGSLTSAESMTAALAYMAPMAALEERRGEGRM